MFDPDYPRQLSTIECKVQPIELDSTLKLYDETVMKTASSLMLVASTLLIVPPVQSAESVVTRIQATEYETADALGLMQGFPPPPDMRVDSSNAIFGVPYNRWSYQNMRRMYPSAPVRAAARPIHLDREIDSDIAELRVKREDGSETNLETFILETYTDAFVVLHAGKVIYERYLNGMTADTPHQMMSVTKSFAGLLALLANSDGLLSEGDLVTRWVPELTESGAFDGATVGQLLNMTNAMAFSEDYHDPGSDIQRYGRVLGLFSPQIGEQLPGNLYDYLVTLEKGPQDHGAQYEYHTPKADVVNWVTNRVTGLSFEDGLANRLWTHLGTDGETYVLLDKNGNLFAGGGLNASPNNLARFAAMMLNNGRVDNQQVIPVEVLEKIQAGASKAQFSKSIDAQGAFADGHWSYRAHWWVRQTPGKESINALGVNGQWISLDLNRQVAIIRQSSQPVAIGTYYDDYMVNAIDSISHHLDSRSSAVNIALVNYLESITDSDSNDTHDAF